MITLCARHFFAVFALPFFLTRVVYRLSYSSYALPQRKVVSGIGLEAYWLSSYLWDFVSLIPSVAFTLIILAAADVTALISGENGVAVFLLFLLYAFSMVGGL